MVTSQISFDVSKSNYIMVYARKGEINARSIVAIFQDSEEEILDLTDKSVTFYALKPDGTKIYNNCTVDAENGTATINLTSQMVSVAGIVNCEYQIFSGNNLLLKVNGLKIVVEDGGDFSEAIESSSEYNTLIAAINEAQGFSDSVGSVSDLTTTEKSSVVGAINEVNGKTIPITQGGTGGITATQARTNLGVMTGTVLYSNDSGTDGTIELSDVYTNYSMLGILFGSNNTYKTTIIHCDIASEAGLDVWFAQSSTPPTGLWYRGTYIDFSGDTVTFNRNYRFLIKNGANEANECTAGGVKVYKIVGYKY